MSRLALPILWLGLIVPTTNSAPRPKEAPALCYVPTTVGTKLQFDIRKMVGGVEVERREGAEAVKKVTQHDGKIIVVTGSPSEDTPLDKCLQYQASDKDVELLAGPGGKVLDRPMVLLKLPVKPGESWKNGEDKYTTVGEEEVVTPAGKFKAVRVRAELENGKLINNAWYVKELGPVKFTSLDIGSTVEVIYEVKSITSPKN